MNGNPVLDMVQPGKSMNAMQALRMGNTFLRPFVERYAKGVMSHVNDSKCINAIHNMVDSFKGGIREIWGLRMLESSEMLPQSLLSGNPSMLGDYDECLDTRGPSFDGQYCLVTTCLSPDGKPCESLYFAAAAVRAAKAMESDKFEWQCTKKALTGLPMRMGMCVPSACSVADVHDIATRALQPLPVGVRVQLNSNSCRVTGDDAFGATDYLVVGLIMALLLWCAFATVYEYATRGRRRNEWVVAFSVLVNCAAVLHLGGGENEGRDTLPPLHGLRAVAFCLVVFGHSFVSFMDGPTCNLEYVREISKKWYAVIPAITPISVDIFLVLGGVLVAYIYFNYTATGGKFKLIPFYLYRYIRLTPALGALVLLQSTVLLKLDDGPLWRLQHAAQCPKTWWYIMLHVCNYYRPETVECLGQLWYLSMDWHLYILSPLILIPLRRHPRRTLIATAAIIVASVVIRFVQAYHYQLRAPWTTFGVQEGLKMLYFPTHARFVPYLMGIVLGYALHHLKRMPSLPVLTKTQIWSVWSLAAVLTTITFYKMWQSVDADLPYYRLEESLFVAVIHFITALVVVIIVFMTMAGYGGRVGRFFSHMWWRPLSRLTYCMYLVHYPVLQSLIWNTRTPNMFSIWGLAMLTFNVWVVSLLMGLVMAVLCECPIVQIARLLIERYSKKLAEAKTTKREKNGDYVLVGHGDVKKDLSEVKNL